MKKYLKIFLKILVSLFFLWLVVYKTDWPEVMFYLKKIEIWQIILYVVVLLLGILISAYKWKKLAEFKEINSSLWDFFKLYLVGTFINNFMPSFIAGDAFKAYAIAGKEKKYNEAVSTVMMDRITGLIGIMILSLMCSILNFKMVLGNGILITINILIILSLFADIIIAELKKITFLKNWVSRVMPKRVIDFLRELYSYNNNSEIIKKTIFLSLVFSLVGVAFLNYILFWGLGIEIGFLDYLSVIFIISIISSLPISINNIGLKEWAYITFFGLFGVTSGAVVAVSVISRFLQMAVSFFALPAYLKAKKK
ncbi:MAG TPA: lysylphosphatidylglycerol synthase transmembrane domain-containing protein [Candidatus Moranbacteria bacterium]|nr:lysylphosphatidylglycerol synthase transmembrane domain-containing protein [Candidatus Moranbacteria bacterium]